MFSRRYGSGPQVVVGLHGWSGDHRTFEPLNPWKPDSASILSFDLPGYGRSPEPNTWTLPAIAKDVANDIAALKAERITLVGNCSGAIIGLHVARLLKEQVERLVLVDPFAYFPWYFKLFLLGRFGRYAYSTTFGTPVGRFLTNSALRHRRTADSHLTASFAKSNHAVVHRYLQMLHETGDFQQFRDITTPLVIAYGERTFVAVRQSVNMWKGLWPHAVSHQLRGAGHLPIEEAPEQLAALAFGTHTSDMNSERGAGA
jgi:pimeloyl-ACP methyl ester carboxylesterase